MENRETSRTPFDHPSLQPQTQRRTSQPELANPAAAAAAATARDEIEDLLDSLQPESLRRRRERTEDDAESDVDAGNRSFASPKNSSTERRRESSLDEGRHVVGRESRDGRTRHRSGDGASKSSPPLEAAAGAGLLQREVALHPSEGRSSIPRIASLPLSNQHWLGPSVQNSGHHRLNSTTGAASHSGAAAAASSQSPNPSSLPSVPISGQATGQSGHVCSQLMAPAGGVGGVGGMGDSEARVGPSPHPPPPLSHAAFPEIGAGSSAISNESVLNARIASLFDRPELADVTLIVGGQRFEAHRLILAAGSPVFRVMLLSSAWQDSRQREIELEERKECVPVFALFLRYFYTGRIELTTDSAIPVLFLADKYAVEDLRDGVVDFMVANIAQQSDTNRTISWYQYAKTCGHSELKNRCCEFIVWNMRVVIKSPDWINVDLENLVEFLDYSDMVITDEYTLLKALEIWVRTNSVDEGYDDDAPPSASDDPSPPSSSSSASSPRPSSPPRRPPSSSPAPLARAASASPLPSARALLDRVLPHVRFPMIKPEQLALLEEDSFVRKYAACFDAFMVNAYKYHAVPKEHRRGDAFLFGNSCTQFRNYTNRNISIHMQFDNYSQRSRSNFTWQFSTLASASNADVLNKIKWEINFRPKGYSDYYNNNESTRFTLELQNKEISMETDIAIFVLTRHQETNFVNLVTRSTFVFGGDAKVFKIENLLSLGELLKKECPMIIDDTLNLIVFVKAKTFAQ